MDFIGEAAARLPMAVFAIAASVLFAFVVLRRLAPGARPRESARVLLALSGLYIFALLFRLSRIGDGWPFGAALALEALVWSVTLSCCLMALTEPRRISQMLSGDAEDH